MSVPRFIAVGAANTVVGYGATLVSYYMLGFGHIAANTAGYLIGGVFSYFAHRSFTFKSQRAHRVALPLFAVTVLGCFLFNLAVLQAGISFLSLPVAIAQALAMAAYTTAFYIVTRSVVFQSQPVRRDQSGPMVRP